MLTKEQHKDLKNVISNHMMADRYENYLVQSIYLDTDNWDVIRASLNKPIYKEKMRMRCYGIPERGSMMFLELKKKYRGIVYKRRIEFPMERLMHDKADTNLREIIADDTSQIGRELAYYLSVNPVYERAHVSYFRNAFSGNDDAGLRVTFDTDAFFRWHSLDYETPGEGHEIFSPDLVLMEIKTQTGIPLWLARLLSDKKIYPISFSKYGIGYTKYILQTKGHMQWTSLSAAQ